MKKVLTVLICLMLAAVVGGGGYMIYRKYQPPKKAVAASVNVLADRYIGVEEISSDNGLFKYKLNNPNLAYVNSITVMIRYIGHYEGYDELTVKLNKQEGKKEIISGKGIRYGQSNGSPSVVISIVNYYTLSCYLKDGDYFIETVTTNEKNEIVTVSYVTTLLYCEVLDYTNPKGYEFNFVDTYLQSNSIMKYKLEDGKLLYPFIVESPYLSVSKKLEVGIMIFTTTSTSPNHFSYTYIIDNPIYTKKDTVYTIEPPINAYEDISYTLTAKVYGVNKVILILDYGESKNRPYINERFNYQKSVGRCLLDTVSITTN